MLNFFNRDREGNAFESLRKEYYERHDKFSPAVSLDPSLLKNCRTLSNRFDLLDYLPQNATCAEVGVLYGDYSESIVKKTNPQSFYLLDIRDDYLNYTEQRIRDAGYSGELTKVLGDSKETLSTLPEASFDWIYIDGGHEYQPVWHDLINCDKLIKPDGLIIANDYIFYNHFEAQEYGVVQAVNQFCTEYNYEFVFFVLHPQMFCDVAIRPLNK